MQKLSGFKLPRDFRGRGALIVQLWWIVEASLFRPSPQVAYGWRRFLLRLFGAKIGNNVIIRPTVRTTYPWKVAIGNDSWIGDDVVLYSLGNITIGSDAVVSQGAYLCTGSHDYRSANFDIFQKPIKIGDGTWLAAKVFVHPGVVIGENAVVDACSVVKADVEAGFVYSGFPAIKIRSRY